MKRIKPPSSIDFTDQKYNLNNSQEFYEEIPLTISFKKKRKQQAAGVIFLAISMIIVIIGALTS